MANYKRFFCSFADSRLKKSLERIESQANEMQVYDHIYIYDETKLDPAFRATFRDQLKFGSRGFGYWCWKPQIILQTFEKMDYGDVLQYSDSGCHLNKNGRKRLEEYFEIAKRSLGGILSFRTRRADEITGNEVFYGNLEYKYNKADLLDYFGVLDQPAITHSVQYEAGIIFIRKDETTIAFIKRWIETFTESFSFINDAPSAIPNLEGFIEHRHDQSIYSILCKLHNVEDLYSSEYYTSGDWSLLADFPIWVKRDMKYSLLVRAINFLKRKRTFLIGKLTPK